MDENDRIMGMEAAARYCGISSKTLKQWMNDGKMKGCYNILSPRKIVFSRSALDRMIWGSL